MRALFESSASASLDGGPTLNPSTYELLAGIHDVAAEEVVVLPNSPNVIMAAERAAELSEKVVRVVPTALAAGRAWPSRSRWTPRAAPPRTPRRWARRSSAVRTGGVAPAAREDPQGRFAVGDAVGFVDDELVAWGEPEATLRDRARRARRRTPSC